MHAKYSELIGCLVKRRFSVAANNSLYIVTGIDYGSPTIDIEYSRLNNLDKFNSFVCSLKQFQDMFVIVSG